MNKKFLKTSHRLKKMLRDAFIQMQMYCDIANHKVNLKHSALCLKKLRTTILAEYVIKFK